MEQLMDVQGRQQTPRDGASEVWRLRKRMDQYLMERGVGHFCNVTVRKSGQWFELAGCVDGQWSRAILFSMVPKQGGKQYIVDRLQIVDGPLERSGWA